MKTTKQPLIGLAGPAGAGKTYLALTLVKELGFERGSYADKLRKVASVLFGVPTQTFRLDKYTIDPFWNMTPREMLQKLGTDACRNHIVSNIWVKSFWRDADMLYGGYPLVIDDVRFPDEAQAIIDRGGIIYKIESDGAFACESPPWWKLWRKRHASEKPLPWRLVYRTFRNDKRNYSQAAEQLLSLVEYDIKTRWTT